MMSKKRIFRLFNMKKTCFLLFYLFVVTFLQAQPKDYEWTTPSVNSSESMPCGGGDIGMNVWVENGDVLFYLSRSGCFDENNTLLKLGRFRISLSPGLDMQSFRQILHLKEGYVEVTDGQTSVQLWADVNKPVVHVRAFGLKQKLVVGATYENWRTQDKILTSRERFQSSYKFSAPKGLKTLRDSVWQPRRLSPSSIIMVKRQSLTLQSDSKAWKVSRKNWITLCATSLSEDV